MFQFPAAPTVGQNFTPIPGVSYQWNGTGWVFIPSPPSLLPAGLVMPYAGILATLGAGWLVCDGQSFATTLYPALFAAIGYAYGGAGANFNVPDLRGRVVAGMDNMGGPMGAAGRLTAATINTPSGQGGVGGAQVETLTAAQVAPHTHTGTTGNDNADHTHSGTTGNENATHTHTQIPSTSSGIFAGGGAAGNFAGSQTGGQSVVHQHPFTTGGRSSIHQHDFTTAQNAGGQAHNNVQPTIVMHYLIKT